MSILKKLFLTILIGTITTLSAINFDLKCHSIFTTITTQKRQAPYVSKGSNEDGKTKITISFRNKKIFIIGAYKQELFLIGRSSGGVSYLFEKTKGGNINLYALFDDGTLTISKSYDVFGMAKLNVQTIYKCK